MKAMFHSKPCPRIFILCRAEPKQLLTKNDQNGNNNPAVSYPKGDLDMTRFQQNTIELCILAKNDHAKDLK
jgi:hypothetical protein